MPASSVQYNTSPWYREPMMWLAVGLPAAAVLAGFATLAIALHAPSAALAEPTQRAGIGQTGDWSADLAAARQQLSASLSIDGSSGAVHCTVSIDAAENLTLLLVHASDGAQDVRATLVRNGVADYVGRIAVPLRGVRGVQLVASAAQWRLVGVLPTNADQVRLRPALDIPRG